MPFLWQSRYTKAAAVARKQQGRGGDRRRSRTAESQYRQIISVDRCCFPPVTSPSREGRHGRRHPIGIETTHQPIYLTRGGTPTLRRCRTPTDAPQNQKTQGYQSRRRAEGQPQPEIWR